MEKKLKRSELKAIVKECLVEILMEGVAPQYASKVNESKSTNVMQQQGRQQSARQQTPAARSQNTYINEVAKQIVPNDPVMAAIFSDTATTTLREQVAADSGRQPHTQAHDTGIDPMSLFDSSKNWASLAFSETTKK